MSNLGTEKSTLAVALIAFCAFAAFSLNSSHAAAAGVPAPVLAMLERSASARILLRETDEGIALARRLIGRPIRTEADFRLFARELGLPARAQIAEEFAARVRSFEFVGAETPSRNFATVRAGFLSGETGMIPPLPTNARPSLNVAAVQYPIEGGRTIEQLLSKLEAFARQAKAGGAELVVFPELISHDLMFVSGHGTEIEQLTEIARTSTPRLFARAAELSRELNLAILSGSSPRQVEEGIVNTAQLSLADGRIVLQDKIFLTPDEAAWGWKPGKQLKVFDAPWGRTTILICYDSQFPALSAALGPAAPELFLVPSMTGTRGFDRVRWAAQARAVEHHAFVVVTGDVDAIATTREFTGQAAILTPQEEGFPGLLASGPMNESAVVHGQLDLARLRASRASTGIYSSRDTLLRSSPIEIRFE